MSNVQDIRRLIEIAVIDTLAMDNSIQKSRTLVYLAPTALKSLEVGEVQDRLGVLEELILGRRTTFLDQAELIKHVGQQNQHADRDEGEAIAADHRVNNHSEHGVAGGKRHNLSFAFGGRFRSAMGRAALSSNPAAQSESGQYTPG